MPFNTIYEDQENQVPTRIHPGKQIPLRERNTKSSNVNINKNKPVNNGKRRVLGTITNVAENLNSNVRIQPSRNAKQNTQQNKTIDLTNDENDYSKQKSFAQSFEIHSDYSENSSDAQLKVRETKKPQHKNVKSLRDSKKITQDEKSIEGIENIARLQRPPSVTSTSSVMDMSVCDDDVMVIESPSSKISSASSSVASSSKSKTPEELLSTTDEDFYDVTEYREEIYQYLREAEKIHKSRPNYMAKQSDITNSMRWILVDWLVEVSEEYNLHTETLYLAISYIDRFLSHMSVKRDKLQLVGTTAMFIASKYEEIYPPDVTQFAYITNNTYKVNQILRMEHLMLKVLSFDMAVPTCYIFVSEYAKINSSSEENLHLALFLAELSLLDGDPFLRYLPSMIAASAIALANHTQGNEAWPKSLQEFSKYSLEDLQECYINLKRVFARVNDGDEQTHAIRDKYKSSKYNAVSTLTPRNGCPWDVGVV